MQYWTSTMAHALCVCPAWHNYFPAGKLVWLSKGCKSPMCTALMHIASCKACPDFYRGWFGGIQAREKWLKFLRKSIRNILVEKQFHNATLILCSRSAAKDKQAVIWFSFSSGKSAIISFTASPWCKVGQNAFQELFLCIDYSLSYKLNQFLGIGHTLWLAWDVGGKARPGNVCAV